MVQGRQFCLSALLSCYTLTTVQERLIARGTLIDSFPDWPGEVFPLYAVRPYRRLVPATIEAFLACYVVVVATPPVG